MNAMNNLKKILLSLFLIGFYFAVSGQTQHIDRASLELDLVSNLLKWSDLIVVATRDEYSDSIEVEEFILKKRLNIDSSNQIELNTLIEHEHAPPVVMDSYRYLLFLTVLDKETKLAEAENKIVCKITGGSNGLIALFNLDELKEHRRVLRMKRIMPKYDFIQVLKNELQKNFGTSDGLKIKEAVERVVALYEEEDPKAQAQLFIESLRDGNPAMIRLSRELLQSIELEVID